jgi:serine/threonine-protein kinase
MEFITQFHIIDKIANGGMGTVYHAEQIGSKGFKKTVALKTIHHELTSNAEALEMLAGEAKLVADLVHENIVQVYQFAEIGDKFYLVMEYVLGPNLAEVMERHRFAKQDLPADVIAFIILGIAKGLDYAHKKRNSNGERLKIVHRDISPSNVIVSSHGVVKLTDFGIAKALGTKVPDEREVIMGKYQYMSPEQAKLQGSDFRSDIYALGLVAYELTLQRLPYNVDNDVDLLKAIKNPIIAPHHLRRDIPISLSNIMMKALAIDPNERYQSAGEMKNHLKKFLFQGRYFMNSESLGKYMENLFPENRKKPF